MVPKIFKHPSTAITMDGGPHTFWWPTQGADGSLRPMEIPPPQIIREMQPKAKFIVTLADPVRRLYSDYHFLNDNRQVARPGDNTDHKSPLRFHERAEKQVKTFKACVNNKMLAMATSARGNATEDSDGLTHTPSHPIPVDMKGKAGPWFRAAQECAHDRKTFALAGHGRLSIGLYVLYLQKWLEHFDPSQFLIVRLEDYEADPRGYMARVFRFLNLTVPADDNDDAWRRITGHNPFNQHRVDRESMLPITETLLRDFHRPFNALLALVLEDRRFLWEGLNTTEAATKDSTAVKRASSRDSRKSPMDRLHEVDGPKFPHELHDVNGDAQEAQAEAAREKLERSFNAHHPERVHGEAADEEQSHEHTGTSEKEGSAKTSASGRVHLPVPADKSQLTARPPSLRGAKSKLLPPREKTDRQLEQRENKNAETPSVTLAPHSFSLDGLPRAEEDDPFNEFVSKVIKRDDGIDSTNAADALCAAALGMDYAALEYVLYDVGVPVNIRSSGKHTAGHCLGAVLIFGDAVSRSYVFNMLKGIPSWLTPYLVPHIEIPTRSVRSLDIKNSLAGRINGTLHWLMRAGADLNAQNSLGHTLLHFAAQGGLTLMAQELLIHGADPNILNDQKKSPLHYAAVTGYTQIAAMLVKYGADLGATDIHGVRPIDIISNPGVISPEDAMTYFNIAQNPVRTIDRTIHPEANITLWVGGTGGYGMERLVGYEEDMDCGVDQFWADEITGVELFEKYIARSRPVLIRGLIDDWPAVERYSLQSLLGRDGRLMVQQSSIPYSSKFGGDGTEEIMLEDYLHHMRNHSLVGGKHPWYVFVGTPLGRKLREDSLVDISVIPTPPLIGEAMHYVNMGANYNHELPANLYDRKLEVTRKDFINAQWALGGEGTVSHVWNLS